MMKLSSATKWGKKPVPWVLALVAAALTVAALMPQPRPGESNQPRPEQIKLAPQQSKVPVSASPTRGSLKEQPAPRLANNDGAKVQEDWWARFGHEMKSTNVTTMIVAGLVLLVATLQAWYAIVSVSMARQNAKAAEVSATVALQAIERAYIRLDNFALQRFGPGETPVITYSAKNEGRTPGDILSLSVNYVIAAELPDNPAYDPEGPGALTIPPGRSFPTYKFFQQPLTHEQFANVTNGTWACFLWVCLIYKDTFGILHTEGFAMKYAPLESHRSIDADGRERVQQRAFRIHNADGFSYSARTVSQPSLPPTIA